MLRPLRRQGHVVLHADRITGAAERFRAVDAPALEQIAGAGIAAFRQRIASADGQLVRHEAHSAVGVEVDRVQRLRLHRLEGTDGLPPIEIDGLLSGAGLPPEAGLAPPDHAQVRAPDVGAGLESMREFLAVGPSCVIVGPHVRQRKDALGVGAEQITAVLPILQGIEVRPGLLRTGRIEHAVLQYLGGAIVRQPLCLLRRRFDIAVAFASVCVDDRRLHDLHVGIADNQAVLKGRLRQRLPGAGGTVADDQIGPGAVGAAALHQRVHLAIGRSGPAGVERLVSGQLKGPAVGVAGQVPSLRRNAAVGVQHLHAGHRGLGVPAVQRPSRDRQARVGRDLRGGPAVHALDRPVGKGLLFLRDAQRQMVLRSPLGVQKDLPAVLVGQVQKQRFVRVSGPAAVDLGVPAAEGREAFRAGKGVFRKTRLNVIAERLFLHLSLAAVGHQPDGIAVGPPHGAQGQVRGEFDGLPGGQRVHRVVHEPAVEGIARSGKAAVGQRIAVAVHTLVEHPPAPAVRLKVDVVPGHGVHRDRQAVQRGAVGVLQLHRHRNAGIGGTVAAADQAGAEPVGSALLRILADESGAVVRIPRPERNGIIRTALERAVPVDDLFLSVLRSNRDLPDRKALEIAVRRGGIEQQLRSRRRAGQGADLLRAPGSSGLHAERLAALRAGGEADGAQGPGGDMQHLGILFSVVVVGIDRGHAPAAGLIALQRPFVDDGIVGILRRGDQRHAVLRLSLRKAPRACKGEVAPALRRLRCGRGEQRHGLRRPLIEHHRLRRRGLRLAFQRQPVGDAQREGRVGHGLRHDDGAVGQRAERHQVAAVLRVLDRRAHQLHDALGREGDLRRDVALIAELEGLFRVALALRDALRGQLHIAEDVHGGASVRPEVSGGRPRTVVDVHVHRMVLGAVDRVLLGDDGGERIVLPRLRARLRAAGEAILSVDPGAASLGGGDPAPAAAGEQSDHGRVLQLVEALARGRVSEGPVFIGIIKIDEIGVDRQVAVEDVGLVLVREYVVPVGVALHHGPFFEIVLRLPELDLLDALQIVAVVHGDDRLGIAVAVPRAGDQGYAADAALHVRQRHVGITVGHRHLARGGAGEVRIAAPVGVGGHAGDVDMGIVVPLDLPVIVRGHLVAPQVDLVQGLLRHLDAAAGIAVRHPAVG